MIFLWFLYLTICHGSQPPFEKCWFFLDDDKPVLKKLWFISQPIKNGDQRLPGDLWGTSKKKSSCFQEISTPFHTSFLFFFNGIFNPPKSSPKSNRKKIVPPKKIDFLNNPQKQWSHPEPKNAKSYLSEKVVPFKARPKLKDRNRKVHLPFAKNDIFRNSCFVFDTLILLMVQKSGENPPGM